MKVKNEYTVLPVYPIYVFSNLFHYWRNKVFNCIAQLWMVDNKMYRWCFCFCYHSPLSLMNQYLQIMKSGSCTYPQYVIRIFSGKRLRITHVRPVFLFTVWYIGFTKKSRKDPEQVDFCGTLPVSEQGLRLQAFQTQEWIQFFPFALLRVFLSSVFVCCPCRAG